jgi:hypothetical protein
MTFLCAFSALAEVSRILAPRCWYLMPRNHQNHFWQSVSVGAICRATGLCALMNSHGNKWVHVLSLLNVSRRRKEVSYFDNNFFNTIVSCIFSGTTLLISDAWCIMYYVWCMMYVYMMYVCMYVCILHSPDNLVMYCSLLCVAVLLHMSCGCQHVWCSRPHLTSQDKSVLYSRCHHTYTYIQRQRETERQTEIYEQDFINNICNQTKLFQSISIEQNFFNQSQSNKTLVSLWVYSL